MKRLVPMILAVLLVACETETDPTAELIAALPDESIFEIELPGESEDGVMGRIDAPLIGRPSGMRDLVRGVRRFLGTSLRGFLDHIDRVTATRPALETPDRVLWRLRAPGGDKEYGVVLNRLGNGRIGLSAWLRPVRTNGAPVPWRFLMAGTMTDAAGVARGSLWLDLDNDLHPRSRGKMLVLWSLGARRLLEVTVFNGTPDDDEVGRLTRTYRFEATADGGSLTFDAGEVDVHLLPSKAGKERVRVAARWRNQDPAYRADYAAIGPEVARDGFRALLGGECWSPPDASIEYEQRLGLPGNGDPAVTLWEEGDRQRCPYPAQEVPIVPAPGAEPTLPMQPRDLDDLEALDTQTP